MGYWKREPFVYQAGLLANLPAGVAAPQYFGVEDLSNETVWLWLEDMGASSDSPWLLSRYALAARHIGQFNGVYLVRDACPSFPWLRQDYLRAWVALGGPGIGQLPDVVGRPLVDKVYPSPVVARLLRVWEQREALLTELAGLPQTFCHMDVMRRNLISRQDMYGHDQTVLIDRGEVGIGALGEDLAAFVTANVFLEPGTPPAQDLEGVGVTSYIDGLRDIGWHGDIQLVRRGYTRAAALRVLGGTTWVLQTILDNSRHDELERVFGQPIQKLLERWAKAISVVVDGVDKDQR